MKWPEVPQQAPGSNDCTFFATAYLTRLLGCDCVWTDVKDWYTNSNPRYATEVYPFRAHGIKPAWTVWGNIPGVSFNNFKQMYSITPNFKEWVLEHLANGEIAYAHTFIVPHIGHAVVLLEADEDGILFADSGRGGLIKDSWESFIHPAGWHPPDERGNQGNVSRIETWYKLPQKEEFKCAKHGKERICLCGNRGKS